MRNFKKESFLIAVKKNYIIRINYIKAKIENIQKISQGYGDVDETINHNNRAAN